MIENLPGYVSIVFIATTFLTVGFLIYAIKRGAFDSTAAIVLNFLLPFWLFFQAVLALGGFYLKTDSPPRIPLFAILPALLVIAALFVFARQNFVSRLPIKVLTILHVVRIPVELTLLWLFQAGQIPQLMTFEGRNFDILSGLTAPIIYWLAFRGKTNRLLLIIWNFAALGLLINIVTNAVLSFPYFYQQFAFEQPSRGIFYFPFIWLPAVVVPIVLFAHLVSLWQLFSKDSIKTL